MKKYNRYPENAPASIPATGFQKYHDSRNSLNDPGLGLVLHSVSINSFFDAANINQ
jgi:hypothetical protein